MQLRLLRYSSQEDDTLGLLFDETDAQNRHFLGYVLEDEARTKKVRGETRIPSGKYEIKLRTEGGFHERYKKKFPDMHAGMLELQAVPGFKYVLIHIGNDDDDTAGCLLVGDQANTNLEHDARILQSTQGYVRIYPPVATALLRGDTVTIEVEDYA